MAALVQGYPQQSATGTMLQGRPTSASGMLQASQSQQGAQYGHGSSQKRHSIHGLPNGLGPVMYRGGSGPIQPYAFTSTPSLNQGASWEQFGSFRTNSAPSVPTMQTFDPRSQPSAARPRYSASASMTNLPSSAAIQLQAAVSSRDDSSLPGPGYRRPVAAMPRSSHSSSTSGSSSQSSQSSQSSVASAAPVKPSPERYRRVAMRSSDSTGAAQSSARVPAPPSGTGMVAVGQNHSSRVAPEQRGSGSRIQLARPNSIVGPLSGSAIDDMQLPRGYPQDDIKRFRRRSMPALDSAGVPRPLAPLAVKQPGESIRLEQSTRPRSEGADQHAARTGNNLSTDNSANVADARTASSDSRSSGRSAVSGSRPSSVSCPSSANRNANVPNPTGGPALASQRDQSTGSQDYPRLVNIPPRSSSSDAASTKRVTNPSPLSKPVAMDKEAENDQAADAAGVSPPSPPKPASPARVESPAVRQLSAIKEGGSRSKSKTSRLRRAFSFGSAAEFRKVVPENSNDAADTSRPGTPGKLHKDRDPEEVYNAEQARIAQQQEEAGIGNNIYAGGRLFSGSTDNLSISSTASSASIMIRKMGRGMKKGTRSLVGLFRPKSVIGAPAADAKVPEASEAAVSMITVEAERARVNVHPDPHAHNGGTGFPHLERNSMDAVNPPSMTPERLGSSGTDNSVPRRSIVGGEKERAEVLAAVRKGILKNTSGSSTPSPRPSETRPAFDVPGIPNISESPNSSAPSTPNDEPHGHRRGGTVTIGSEDYFVSALRLRQDTKSAPGTPQGSMKRNATFSPRIIFHDTWPSQEYDRRGEIATCNRLTPMLAQQIKEELNSFKMEMEVHENSKIYTHFF
ncbi:protein BNI4 [Podospora aff. communis PSN243]|uniref:Protein BNI4 n=1 Tax=Podospora aff. communis PSN243 TaxID=3040156 RepID=A0AAV9H6X7_9PEZI|nr:protein BNI4 [Podospora aff. communis PSN243]